MSQKVLVLDCHEHTLTVIRSLSRAGHRVTLGVTEDNVRHGYVHVSRFVERTWLHPDIATDPAAFSTTLLKFLRENQDIRLIFPVGENSLRMLAGIRTTLPNDVVVAMPDNNTVMNCLDKPSAYQTASDCNIPVPETRIVSTATDCQRAATDLGFPIIVKATDSTELLLGMKCVFVREQSELSRLTKQWPAGETAFVVQSEITGWRHNCDVVAENGRIRLFFEYEILRTDQADYAGNSVFDRSIPPHKTHRDYCERFFAKLNYTGLALVQFLRNPSTGDSVFLEANPRAGSTIALAYHCGVDLPATSVQAHLGDPIKPQNNYPYRRSQNWFHGDLLGLRKARLRKEIGLKQSLVWLLRALADFIRADFHTTFSWNDPKPTLKLYWNLLTKTRATKQK